MKAEKSPTSIKRRVFLASAIGAVAGCSTNSTTCEKTSLAYDDRDWPMLRHDFHNTARVPSGTLDVSEPLELKWSYELPEGYYPPVSIRGDTVFASSGPALHAIDRESGEQRWRFDQRSDGPTVIDGGVSVTDENVFVTERALPEGVTGRIYALDAESGAFEWEFVENGLSMAALAHSRGVFTRTAENGFITLDIDTGTQCETDAGSFSFWSQTNPFEQIFGYPAVDGQHLYATWSDGDNSGVRSHSLSTQEIIWETSTEYDPLGVPLLLTSSSVFVGIGGDEGYSLLGLDREDGLTRWQFALDAELLTPMALANGVLCVCGHRLFGLDTRSGDVMWTFDSVSGMPPIAVGDTFIVSGGSDGIFAIDAQSGNPKKVIEGTHMFGDGPVVADGMLAVTAKAEDGGLVLAYQ